MGSCMLVPPQSVVQALILWEDSDGLSGEYLSPDPVRTIQFASESSKLLSCWVGFFSFELT